jgi:hypothetical protein
MNPNHIEVVGPEYHGEAFAWDAMNAHHLVHKHRTIQTGDDGLPARIAWNLLDREYYSQHRQEITIPFDLRLQLGDSIALTIPWLGQDAAPRFIRSLRGHYARRPFQFQHTIALHGDHWDTAPYT